MSHVIYIYSAFHVSPATVMLLPHLHAMLRVISHRIRSENLCKHLPGQCFLSSRRFNGRRGANKHYQHFDRRDWQQIAIMSPLRSCSGKPCTGGNDFDCGGR